MASLTDTDLFSCVPLVAADGLPGVELAYVKISVAVKLSRPDFFNFLGSLPGVSEGAGGALHLSMQMAVRFAFASCRLGPAVADGAWFPFASTPTAAFFIKFFKAASERPVFDAAQLSGIDAAGQARIFDLVFDASDPRFVITSADVTSASAAVLAAVDLTAAPMAFARADEMCGADRRMYAFATSLLLSPASCDLIALAADDAGAARLIQATASTAHMVSGLYAGAAPGRSSDSTAVYKFIAASSGAKFCLALAHSTAGVVANVHAVETFARDRPAALEENMEAVIQWFPRLHAVLGASTSESPVMSRLYTLVAGMPASTKSPLTTKGLHALDFQVSRLAGQADFKTVCNSLHETAESAAALKAGTTVLRPLLESEAYKLLARASKDVDAKTLVAMALGSCLVVCRLVVLDGLNPALAKQSSQVQVLVELAAKRGAVSDAVRLLMNEDSRIKRSVVPPDVPPYYVSAALRGVLTSTLSDYAELASKFSPKLYAENPYSFAGSNFDIFSSPARVSAALAMFAATLGPLADGFGYEGFDTFVAAVIRATADDGESGPANGARALRLFVAACPPDAAVALRDQPLFSVPGCEPITGELLDGILTAMLAASLGSDAPRYSLHSMRSGAATALRNAGYSDSEICRAFRWASMPCMQGYARTDTAERLDITRTLAEHAPATRVSARARVSTALALAAQSG
jgi:hypothetical protein